MSDKATGQCLNCYAPVREDGYYRPPDTPASPVVTLEDVAEAVREACKAHLRCLTRPAPIDGELFAAWCRGADGLASLDLAPVLSKLREKAGGR